METLRPPESGAERKEDHLKDEAGFGFESASLPSMDHPDRNEDAVLGDPAWLATERACAPRLDTMDPKADGEAIAKAVEIIAENAEALRKKRVVAVFDGISGAKSNGTGAIGSRLAAAAVSRRLSHVPDLITTARAKEIAATALVMADDAIREYLGSAVSNVSKERAEELEEITTTMDLVMFAEGADGGTDAIIAHCGDSRVYRLVAATGELELITTDENQVGLAYAEGKIGSRDDYEAHANALSLHDMPKDVRDRSPFKREKDFMDAGRTLMSAVGAGITEPERRVTSIRVAKGDKILICTDGIHDNLSGKALGNFMKYGATAKNMAKSAKDSFVKPDDISLVIVEVGDLAEARKKREEAKSQLRKKITWAKSAAATINSADIERVEATLLGARKDEAALLALVVQDGLSSVGLSEEQTRKMAREGSEKIAWLDQALAASKLPPESSKLASRRKMRDDMAANVARYADIVADMDSLTAMRQEITETAARMKGPDQTAVDAARRNIDE